MILELTNFESARVTSAYPIGTDNGWGWDQVDFGDDESFLETEREPGEKFIGYLAMGLL